MPKIKHIAVFEFNPTCTAADQARFWKEIESLPRNIGGILEYSGGPNVSSEGLNQGYTNSFVMTFESVAARDAYLPHPFHQAVVKVVLPMLARIVVIDHNA